MKKFKLIFLNENLFFTLLNEISKFEINQSKIPSII